MCVVECALEERYSEFWLLDVDRPKVIKILEEKMRSKVGQGGNLSIIQHVILLTVNCTHAVHCAVDVIHCTVHAFSSSYTVYCTL